jgi:hypothetical protein
VKSDDTDRLKAIFAHPASPEGIILVPPGDYYLDGRRPITLSSQTTIQATGARFHLPATLPDQARIVLFYGENVTNLTWIGGHFQGNVFDPSRSDNPWPPNANTRPILLTTTPDGDTENLDFRDITSAGLAGAVVTVSGALAAGDDLQIKRHARNIRIENCHFLRSGKFMWDYGYLWQITVWPEDYGATEHAQAARYFRHDLVKGPLRIEAGDSRIWFDNSTPLPVTPAHDGPEALRGHDWICFFGDTLPANLNRGRRYAVIESVPEYIRIAETIAGPPIVFATTAGRKVQLIANLFEAHLALFSPVGAGPGKGALDLVGCENVTVHGCELSALGDTMHIQNCREIVFTGNRITGSRMGAFFLAEYCAHARVENNFIDGTNGSRVMSVEKSCANITVRHNTFINGGRGSWINQPRGFVLENNVFNNNTTKSEPETGRGRRSFLTGGYEQWAELYFTTYEVGAHYGPVEIRGNTFTSGANAAHALLFEPGGRDITVTANKFDGPVRSVAPTLGCSGVTFNDNSGLQVP